MVTDLGVKIAEKDLEENLLRHYRIRYIGKDIAIIAGIIATGLGALLGNPNLLYIGASAYQAQMEV